MKRVLLFSLALWLSVAPYTTVFARGNMFKVRYKGGTLASNIRDSNWNNQLTITPTEITLVTVDGKSLRFNPKEIESIDYSQKKTRHATTWIPLAIIVAPAFAWFTLDEKRKHFFGVRFKRGEVMEGFLIEVKNQDSKAFVHTLETVAKMTIKDPTVKEQKWYDMN
jgi:hypothetical protein